MDWADYAVIHARQTLAATGDTRPTPENWIDLHERFKEWSLRDAAFTAAQELFGAYPLMVGLLTVAMFAMHGAIYLYLKVPRGELHERVGRWLWTCWGSFLTLYMLTTMYTLIAVPTAVPHVSGLGAAGALVVVNVLAIANIPRATFLNKMGEAFVSSCAAIATLVALLGIALWPNLVTARNDPSYSITVYRAASSSKTLATMLIIAIIGIPLVLTYTAIVYWTFRRRVDAEANY